MYGAYKGSKNLILTKLSDYINIKSVCYIAVGSSNGNFEGDNPLYIMKQQMRFRELKYGTRVL